MPEGEENAGIRTGPLAATAHALAIAGGLLMLATAGLVTFSIVMRWLTSQSVPGDIEIVQITTALAVFAFLPLCQAQRGNIMVDTFTLRLPRRVRDAIDALWDVVYAAFAGMIAWRLAIGAWDTLRSNTVSMVLGIPIGWAIALCAVMAALLTLVAIATANRLIRPRV